MTLLFSIIIYLLPIFLGSSVINGTNTNKNNFYILSCSEMSLFFFIPVLYVYVLNFSWESSAITSWFGHILYTSYQSKMLYLIFLFFWLILYLFLNTTYLSSSEIYDFFITKVNFVYWMSLLFFTNSLFTIIFVIEIISTLVFLLITTSIFSTTFFYKNINFDSKNFFHHNSPYLFLQALLFYFWVSLISSLNLFIFLIFFYNNFLTLDYFLLENIFNYLILVNSFKDLYVVGVIWFVIIFSIFLKCGIVPLFLWKPTFFKGISFSTLIFYIIFIYFFLFLFFINFLNIYFHELFYYYSFVTVFIITLGLMTLFFILCESFFLKTFLAVSSILNSLLVFLSLCLPHTVDVLFFL